MERIRFPRDHPIPGEPDYDSWRTAWEEFARRRATDPMTSPPVPDIHGVWSVPAPVVYPDTPERRAAQEYARLHGPPGVADMTIKGGANRPPSREALRRSGERAAALARRRLTDKLAEAGAPAGPPQPSLLD